MTLIPLPSHWTMRCCLAVVSAMVFSICSAKSQELDELQVRGVVVDSNTKAPLQGVRVFVRYQERLTWWQKLVLTSEGPRKPRRGLMSQNWTDSRGMFAADVRNAVRERKTLGRATWPPEISLVQYSLCGYETRCQQVESDFSPQADPEPLVLGLPQRIEMHRAQPGSPDYSEKC